MKMVTVKTGAKFILLASILGVLSWMTEGLADYYTFHGGKGSIWNALVYISPNELITRTAVLVAFVMLGLAMAVASRRRMGAVIALQESEEKYKNLIETTDTGYLIIDMQGKVIDANAEYVRLTGHQSLEDILGHSILEWTASYDLERNYQEVKKCVENGFVRNLNIDYVSPGGRVTPIEINATVIESADGPRILTLCRDVTERRKTEQALGLTQFSVDHSSDGAFWIDSEARFKYVNDAACKSLKYSREELLNMTVFDIDPSFSREHWDETWRELEKKGSDKLESVHQTKEGEVFPIEVTTNFLEFGGQKYDFAFVRNISERKQAEENLLHRSRQLEKLSNASRQLNAVLEIPAVMRTLVASALDLVDAESGAAGLSVDGKIVFSECNHRGEIAPHDYKYDVGCGVPGTVAQTKMSYMTNDTENDPLVNPDVQKALGFYNLVNTPIITKDGKLLGVLEIHDKSDHRPFDEIDVVMVEGLASGAAIAIENAQLILERRKAEEALRESEERLHSLVDAAPYGAQVYELQPDGRLVFTAANRSADEILGVDNRQFIGKTIEAAFPALAMTEIPAEYRRIAAGGGVFESEQFDYDEGGISGVFELHSFQIGANRIAVFFRDVTEQKRVEQEKRQFYRETIRSVTQGKLELVSFDEVKVYLESAELVVDVASPADTPIARHAITEFCNSRGLCDDRLGLYESAVGEAITNAVKHAKKGCVYAGFNDGSIYVAISDSGPGISALTLPGATLRRGFSTKTSMGMGYSIMMEASDNIILCTGAEGTIVVLSINTVASEQALSLDDFPDTWNT